MKKNDWILITATLIYSYLFYQQSAGLNYFIFNLALIGFLMYRDSDLFQKKKFWIATTGSLISSFYILYYSSNLAIVANLFSLAFLSATCLPAGASFITSITHTAISVGGSFVFMIIDWTERAKKKVVDRVSTPFYAYLLLICVALVIGFVFFFLYRGANPLFKDFTKNFNLDFISIGWIFFTLGGAMLLYAFFYNRRIAAISWFDEHIPNDLTPSFAESSTMKISWLKTKTEFLSGVLLLILLNFLLLLVNGLDLHYLWFDGTLPKGMMPKEFVHDGVGALITSIVLAILIMLFYFRGLLNFHPKNKFLKALAILWIVQNIFMIVSTAFRNDIYITASGLSYKKIGVYVYLLLAAIGLLTTLYKLLKNKSNWSLVKVNAFVSYLILVLSCTINWDVVITDFNVEKAKDPSKRLEKYYLADIGFKNLPQLLVLPDTVVENDDYNARDYYFSSRGVFFGSFQTAIHNKLFRFMTEMQDPDWRSFCFEKERVLNDIMELEKNKRLDSLDLSDFQGTIHTLEPIRSFKNLRVLKIKKNYLDDLSELKMFPKLEDLKFDSCWMNGTQKIPAMKELRILGLHSCNMNTISFLSGLPNLEVLDLRENTISDLTPLYGCKKLKKLFINNITLEQYEILKRELPAVEFISSFK